MRCQMSAIENDAFALQHPSSLQNIYSITSVLKLHFNFQFQLVSNKKVSLLTAYYFSSRPFAQKMEHSGVTENTSFTSRYATNQL